MIFLLVFLSGQFVFAQRPEQIALNFYAENIFSEVKKTKVHYDGMVNPIDEKYYELAEMVISKFYYCKSDPRGINNEHIIIPKEKYISEISEIGKYEFKNRNKNDELLIVPKSIKSKHNLKYKKLRGSSISFYAEKIWHTFFPVKYNLTVEPYISYKNHSYVMLRASKRDFEYGKWYFIKIDNKNNVVDWCEIAWIQ